MGKKGREVTKLTKPASILELHISTKERNESGDLACVLAAFCQTLYNITSTWEWEKKKDGKGVGGGGKNNKTCLTLEINFIYYLLLFWRPCGDKIFNI